MLADRMMLLSSVGAALPPWGGLAFPATILAILGVAAGAVIWWRVHDSMRPDTWDLLTDSAIAVASNLVVWLAGAYALAAIGFTVGVQPGWAAAVGSAAAVVALSCLLMPEVISRYGWTWLLSVQLLSVVAVLATIGFTGLLYDTSFDGQFYHQEAVLQIHEGWNPVYESDAANMVWIRHYPKASWYQGAAILAFTDRIETGKAPTAIMTIAGYLIALVAVSIGYPALRRWAPFLAILLALGPVAAVQWSTYYVDGLLGSAIVVLLASTVVAVLRPRLWSVCVATALGAVATMTGLKFTGLAYAVILLAGVGPLLWLAAPSSRHRRFGLASAALVLFVSVTILGFNPYVTNTIDYGHPFYPVAGTGSIDIISAQVDESFLQRSTPSRFALSHFSASGDVPRLKFPLLVSWSELQAFVDADTRHGGFGPLFGAALLASLLTVPVVVSHIRSASKKYRRAIIWAFGMFALSIAINSESWWARLAPQFWLAPVTLAVVALGYSYRNQDSAARAHVPVAIVPLALLAANLTMVVAVNSFSQAILSEQTVHVLNGLRSLESDGVALEVDARGHLSGVRRLEEAGLSYELLDLEGQGELLPGMLVRIRLR